MFSSLCTLFWLLTQACALLIGWIVLLGLSVLLQRVGFIPSKFSAALASYVWLIFSYSLRVFSMVSGETRLLQRGWRENPPFSKCSEVRCVKVCERQQSPTVLERQESTTPLQAEGRQKKIHPSYTRVAHIASWKDQFVSSDYRDLQVLD